MSTHGRRMMSLKGTQMCQVDREERYFLAPPPVGRRESGGCYCLNPTQLFCQASRVSALGVMKHVCSLKLFASLPQPRGAAAEIFMFGAADLMLGGWKEKRKEREKKQLASFCLPSFPASGVLTVLPACWARSQSVWWRLCLFLKKIFAAVPLLGTGLPPCNPSTSFGYFAVWRPRASDSSSL